VKLLIAILLFVMPVAILDSLAWNKLSEQEKDAIIQLTADGYGRVHKCNKVRVYAEDSGYAVRLYMECNVVKESA